MTVAGGWFDADAWTSFYRAEIAAGRCPYSGESIVSCKESDMCDCFDIPEVTS